MATDTETAARGPTRAVAPDDPLLAYRDRFPILADTNYLISNSLGAVPAEAAQHVAEYVDTWARRGVRAWEEKWWDMTSSVGDLVAPLLGAARGEVVFQPCVTIGHAIVFSAFDFDTRPRVVTDAMHFPSILYLLDGLKHRGAEVTVVPSSDGVGVDTERVVEAIDDSTALVNLSHVLFKSAYVHDIGAIAARAREVGAFTVIDGYQAVGTVPVDVHALGVDAYLGGCLKWLCGGPGAAFLWVAPRHWGRLEPRVTGWMSHVEPFAFAPELQRRADAWRFLTGTPNISALYAVRPGLEIIAAAGVEAIRAKSVRQTGRLMAGAAARGHACTAPTDPARRGGTVAIDVPHGYEVSQELKAQKILCDFRPGAGIRLSPHFYTRDEELGTALDALDDVLASGAWKRHAGKRGAVT